MATELVTKPTGTTLQRLAEQSWERIGGESLLIFEGERFTGGQLAQRTRRFAQGLVEAGLQPGDRVVLCMANCPEVGIAYNAIWRAGGVTTPVLFLLSDDELRHVLSDSEAAYVITTPDFLAKVQAAGAGIDTLRGLILATGEAPGTLSYAELESGPEGALVDRDPADMAALLYTGGTTGRSKGVMLSHNAMSAAAWAAVSRSHDAEMNVALTPLPLSHAYGLLVSTLGLHAPDASTSVLMRWFDPAGWLSLAVEHRATIGAVVPSMLQMLLAMPLEDHDLSALKRMTSGGAPLLAEVRAEAERRLPWIEIMEGYGMTETAALISSSPPGGVRAGSVGLPVPGAEVRLEKPDGSEAAVGEDGEICVRGPMLMTGYWKSPEATAETIRDGMKLATQSLDSGATAAALDKLVAVSNDID